MKLSCRSVQASKNAKRQVPFQFSEEALQEAGARQGVPPFAIVASNTMDMSVGRSVHLHTAGRIYHLAAQLAVSKHLTVPLKTCLCGCTQAACTTYNVH